VYTKDHVHGTAFDWFATGVTCFEFLSGRRPFDAARLQRLYQNQNPAAEEGRSQASPSRAAGAKLGSRSGDATASAASAGLGLELGLEDLRATLQVSAECQDFLASILKPQVRKSGRSRCCMVHGACCGGSQFVRLLGSAHRA
jgi:hypothetical protein